MSSTYVRNHGFATQTIPPDKSVTSTNALIKRSKTCAFDADHRLGQSLTSASVLSTCSNHEFPTSTVPSGQPMMCKECPNRRISTCLSTSTIALGHSLKSAKIISIGPRHGFDPNLTRRTVSCVRVCLEQKGQLMCLTPAIILCQSCDDNKRSNDNIKTASSSSSST